MKETFVVAGSGKGQANLGDARRSSQATIAVTQTFQLSDKPIRNDRRITIGGLATELSESTESVNDITDVLGYSKIYARWVPRSLAYYYKTVRKQVCSHLLSHYEADGESFLSLWSL